MEILLSFTDILKIWGIHPLHLKLIITREAADKGDDYLFPGRSISGAMILKLSVIYVKRVNIRIKWRFFLEELKNCIFEEVFQNFLMLFLLNCLVI